MTRQIKSAADIDPTRPIGELAAEWPARAHLFERLHLDYCCGGQQTLAEACVNAGVQLPTVRAALQALGEMDAQVDNDELTDWRTVSTTQLCAHIISAHHDFLRQEFPRIEAAIATVVRVHGDQDPTLHKLPRAFGRIRSALEPHLASEETELFPAIIAVEHGGPPVTDGTLASHEREHADVGAALAKLRALCHDYDRSRARCGTHRALLDALEGLERDLHQHVHEENNILFPRARSAHLSGTIERRSPSFSSGKSREHMGEPRQPIPVCCQGWIAEQGHRWSTHRK